MKVGTFFSGVGSPEQALRNLDIKHEVEFACEIDKYAKQTYLKNFKPKLYAEDITALDMKNLPYVDLLVFGFPCQAFSMAGKRKGFDDTRGTLFYDALRYLQEHKPRYFIAENVKGLLSHDNGKTFQTIIDCLAKTTNYQFSLMPFENLGYHIHYKVLNTKDFGIPQNRERIFIIGIRDDKDNNFNFPKEIPLKLKLKDILQDNTDYAKAGLYQPYPRNYKELGLERKEQFEERKDEISNCITTGNDQEIIVDEKYYLSDKMVKFVTNTNYESGKPISIEKISKCLCVGGDIPCFEVKAHSLYPRSGDPTKGGTGHLSKQDGTSYCLDTGNAQVIEWIADYRTDEGLRIRKDELSPCLTSSMKDNFNLKFTAGNAPIIKKNRIRRLTPIECERLQGFPDNFTDGVSDTQRYKQMGNTITVNVIQAIIKKLINV